ncbi:serine hydrolase [bacterium]|nr:MAG: serine hydrolase [bacterium]
MVKSLKIIGLIVLAIIILYAISFFFSNAGLGPSYNSKLSNKEQVNIGSMATYSVGAQDIPEVKAKSYMAVDLANDEIIYSRRADSPLLVASLTKLMTAWIVLNYGDMSDRYTVLKEDATAFSPALKLVPGDKVLVSDLFNAMLIGSANDAAAALSRYIEKKQPQSFIELMNQESKKLNMKDTRFSNPNGFDSETNYSSSNDLRILATKLLEKSAFDATNRATGYTFSGEIKTDYQINATNILLKQYSDLRAIKTGFTEEAQGSMINILRHNNQNYLLIVIGSPDRESDTLILRKKVLEIQ